MTKEEIIAYIKDLPVDERAEIADAVLQTLNKPDLDIEKARTEEVFLSGGPLPPKVTDLEPLEDFRLQLTFETGEVRIFDMKPYMYGVFARLEEPGYFERVRIVSGSIEWPNGQDLHSGMLYKTSKPVDS